MRINKELKIEKIVSKDECRIVLQNINIQKNPVGDGAVAVACDGMRLVVVPVEIDNESEYGPLQKQALIQGRKESPKSMKDVDIKLNGDVEIFGGIKMPRLKVADVGNYPNIKHVIPEPDRPVKLRVSFNAKLLAEMQEAMGSESVIIECSEDEETHYPLPILVKPGDGKHTGGKGFGVLMPMKISGS